MCVITAPALIATAAVLSAAASAASIGISAQQASEQGKAARRRGRYENQVALYNSIALKNSGRVEQIKQGIAQRREFGRKRLQYAALGNDISFGSTARRLDETRKFHAMDSVLLSRSVQAKVLGARMRGDAALYNSKVDEMDAEFFGAAGAVRGTAGLAGSINSFVNSGVLDLSANGSNSDSPTARRLSLYGNNDFNFNTAVPFGEVA